MSSFSHKLRGNVSRRVCEIGKAKVASPEHELRASTSFPRGRFLGGSSGSNGTICIRGVKQDYDDWGFPEWSGDEMFRAMKKVWSGATAIKSAYWLTVCQRQKASSPRIGSLTTRTLTGQTVRFTSNLHQSIRLQIAFSNLSRIRDFLTVQTFSVLVRQPTEAAMR